MILGNRNFQEEAMMKVRINKSFVKEIIIEDEIFAIALEQFED
jgi:hypothetical protein